MHLNGKFCSFDSIIGYERLIAAHSVPLTFLFSTIKLKKGCGYVDEICW